MDEQKLREAYEALETEELLALHASGNLTEEAAEVLATVLRERSVPVPEKPAAAGEMGEQPADMLVRARAKASVWAQAFAVIGTVLPVVCLLLAEFAGLDVKQCGPLLFPASFVLFLADWRGGFGPGVLLAVAVNAGTWAGMGWLIGYGASR